MATTISVPNYFICLGFWSPLEISFRANFFAEFSKLLIEIVIVYTSLYVKHESCQFLQDLPTVVVQFTSDSNK